ncbi:MAG: hypothetical protein K1060chlam5_00774 [Candidatus Anoxychlamydiales bacterium]|nr:hypothetical protein [Candidatus Anoxychlamydiales bacterium]
MKKSKIIKIFLVIFILFTFSVFRYFYVKNISKKFYGFINFSKMNISSIQDSFIDKMYIKNKDIVKKGDILFEYNTDLLEAKKKTLLAKLNLINEKKSLVKYKEQKAMDEYLNIKKDSNSTYDINLKLQELEEKQLEHNILLANENELKEEINLLNIQIQNKYFKSPMSGKIVSLYLSEKKYVRINDLILSIIDENEFYIESIMSLNFFNKIKNENLFKAKFLSKPKLKLDIALDQSIDDSNSSKKVVKFKVLSDKSIITQIDTDFINSLKVELQRK